MNRTGIRRFRSTARLSFQALVFLSLASGAVFLARTSAAAGGGQTAAVTVTDIGLSSGYQDYAYGHFKRGRATTAADFDLDGRVDLFLGNPGDESYVVRNTAGPNGLPVFVNVQTLLTGELATAASAIDYDNDGDMDLFISIGGSEGIGFSSLFRNGWIESGRKTLSFQDVTAVAGVRGPVAPGESQPMPVAAEGGAVGDYDLDGWPDIFVSVNIGKLTLPTIAGRNILWRNNRNGTFTDMAVASGLGNSRRLTRHSSWIDIDNDGDLDLYENNYSGRNILWKNLIKETGKADFKDVTMAFSAKGHDLGYPLLSYASAAADFNNDGWQDLIVFMRGSGPEPASPYSQGHALFINNGGKNFSNVAAGSGLNYRFDAVDGVMGCQVGDLNADGVPDIYLANGSPASGNFDRLFLSDSAPGALPHYLDSSYLVDFPAPVDPAHASAYVSYPYKSHGTVFEDFDGDGVLEIAVANGGPAFMGNIQREPNRLFKFNWGKTLAWFKVRPVGNGSTVEKDAIGTRFNLTVRAGSTGTPWVLRGTLFGGSGFSAQSSGDVYFGLKNATQILSLEVIWPDGTRKTITSGLAMNSTYTVNR